MHGYTSSIYDFKNTTKLHEAADTLGFITVYPQSSSISWNTGETVPPYGWPAYDITVGDVGFISALIDTINNHYNIDLNRVYCCGMSSGGEMSFRLAIELGNRLAGAASVNGPLNGGSSAGNPIRPIPILFIHGTADNYIDYENPYGNLWSADETIDFWVMNNECILSADTVSLPDIDTTDGCTVDKISFTSCSAESAVIHYKVIGGGHNWPGKEDSWAGEVSMDIDANVEILNFFRNYENPFTNIACGKSIDIYPRYIRPERNTLVVNAHLFNPQNHQATVYAFMEGKNALFLDSLQLFDDGQNGDSTVSDNIFSNRKGLSDIDEDFYEVKVRIQDLDSNITTYFPLIRTFTNIECPKVEIVNIGTAFRYDYEIELSITNNSSNHSLSSPSLKLIVADSSITELTSSTISFPDISPNSTGKSISSATFNVSDDFDGGLDFDFEVFVEGVSYWNDSLRAVSVDVGKDSVIPLEFNLSQNYPNPFNPTTKISYSIPKQSHVTLKVFDVLGREVATLVNIEQPVGNYEVEFDASSLTSGVYFYRIQAGQFVESKKMILLK